MAAKLKKKFKDRWIKALTSGKYDQGIGRLISCNQDKPKYCCLGVGFDIENGGGRWAIVENDLHARYVVAKDSNGSSVGCLSISDDFVNQYWFKSGTLREITDKINTCSRMNDNGRTFKQIAAYIKRYM